MSSDEEEVPQQRDETPPPTTPAAHHNEHEWNPAEHDGKSEAEIRMEIEKKKRIEKANEEWAEYEAMRKVEREKEEQEIRELRERREKRRKERAEEEKRLTEVRAQEEQRRRSEEEERQRKKKEEEMKKREERERKQREMKEKMSEGANKPNFVIGKRMAGVDIPTDGTPEEKQKSKEQLEAERKAILSQRLTTLNTQGMANAALVEKAKELHKLIYNLESEKYDLQQRFEQQNYDMMELSERARQMNKGSAKGKVNVSTSPDPMAAKISGIPPKVIMYSEYERVKDPRSFGERKTLFTGPLYSAGVERIAPQHKVEMTDMGAKIVGDAETNGTSEPQLNGQPESEAAEAEA